MKILQRIENACCDFCNKNKPLLILLEIDYGAGECNLSLCEGCIILLNEHIKNGD
jgi:hypothetical protein